MEAVRKIDPQTYRQALDRRAPSQVQLDQMWNRLAVSYEHLAGREQIARHERMTYLGQTAKRDHTACQGQTANRGHMANSGQTAKRGHTVSPWQTVKRDHTACQGQTANHLASRKQVFSRGQSPQARRKEKPSMTLIEEEKARKGFFTNQITRYASIAAAIILVVALGLFYFGPSRSGVSFKPNMQVPKFSQSGKNPTSPPTSPLAPASKATETNTPAEDEGKEPLRIARQALYESWQPAYPDDPLLLNHPLNKDAEIPAALPVYMLQDDTPLLSSGTESPIFEALYRSLDRVNEDMGMALNMDTAAKETIPTQSHCLGAVSALSKDESCVVMAAYSFDGIHIYFFPTDMQALENTWPEYNLQQAIYSSFKPSSAAEMLSYLNSNGGRALDQIREWGEDESLRKLEIDMVLEDIDTSVKALTQAWQDLLPWPAEQEVIIRDHRRLLYMPPELYAAMVSETYPASTGDLNFPPLEGLPQDSFTQSLVNSALRKLTWHTENQLQKLADGSFALIIPYNVPVPARLSETYQALFPDLPVENDSPFLLQPRVLAYSLADHTDSMEYLGNYRLRTPDQAQALITSLTKAPINDDWEVIATGMSYQTSAFTVAGPRYVMPCYDFIVQGTLAAPGEKAARNMSEEILEAMETTLPYLRLTISVPAIDSSDLLYADEPQTGRWENEEGEVVVKNDLAFYAWEYLPSEPEISTQSDVNKSQNAGSVHKQNDDSGQGQASLNQGKDDLSQGQDNLSQGQDNLSQGQDDLNQGQGRLSKGQDGLNQGQEHLSKGQEADQKAIKENLPSEGSPASSSAVLNQKKIRENLPGDGSPASSSAVLNQQGQAAAGSRSEAPDSSGQNEKEGIRLFSYVDEAGKLTVTVFNNRQEDISMGQGFDLQRWDGSQWVTVPLAYANTDEVMAVAAGQSQDLNNAIPNYATKDQYRVVKTVQIAGGQSLQLIVEVWLVLE